MSKPRVISFDLDSTIFDTRKRWGMSPIDPKTGEWKHPPGSEAADKAWDDYHEAYGGDTAIKATKTLIRNMFYMTLVHVSSPTEIHIISGRPDTSDWATRLALSESGIPYHELWLRPRHRRHEGWKLQVLKSLTNDGYLPILHVDDWEPTALAIEATGVPVLRVRPPYKEEDRLWPSYAM